MSVIWRAAILGVLACEADWRLWYTAAARIAGGDVIVQPTVDRRVAQPELIALRQRRIAHKAGKALDVEYVMAGAHNQFRGTNRCHTACTLP